ncbi:MAG TPA: Holliday junction resolvase RuvX [Verrucomicrobiae bacterium]|jgi:putative Holliday junction resolvase|nr:Holliday junction resolvase RuvX [Verrucomicrobiae bacterium]
MAVFLGLDLGTKRAGVAVTDEAGIMALPLKTIEVRGRGQLLAELKELVRQYRASEIVVGLPKTLKGEIGIAAQKIIEEVEWLKTGLDVPLVLWDERMSSAEVERLLRDEDVNPARRKEVRDQLAAQRILQNYLDAKRSSPS